MRAIITVVGKDQVGIISTVCNKLAQYNVNVLDISQTVLQGFFTMMMVVEVASCNVPLVDFIEEMQAMGASSGLSIRVQREDIFEAMHHV